MKISLDVVSLKSVFHVGMSPLSKHGLKKSNKHLYRKFMLQLPIKRKYQNKDLVLMKSAQASRAHL